MIILTLLVLVLYLNNFECFFIQRLSFKSRNIVPTRFAMSEGSSSCFSDVINTIKTNSDISTVMNSIKQLEKAQKDSKIDLYSLKGTKWKLIFSTDDNTRSSPFFWAFTKALTENSVLKDRLNPKEIYEFTDKIPLKNIGDAIQTFEEDNILKSQVKVNVDFVGSSLMTTTSKWIPIQEENVIELRVIKTQVLESTIAKFLPFLDSNNNMSFPSGNALELVTPGSSTVYLKVTVLNESVRVVRTAEKVFVFERM